MRINYLTLIVLLSVGISSYSLADTANPESILYQCINNLLCDAGGVNLPRRSTQIFDNAKALPPMTIRLYQENIEEFQCQRFHIRKNLTYNILTWKATVGGVEYERPAGPADLHSLRWQAALDPFWVLHHTLQGYRDDESKYSYQEYTDTEGTWAEFIREETVLLSDPEEKLYGYFQEYVRIDMTNQWVVVYTVTAEDPDGVFLQDMDNTYAYTPVKNSEDVTVSWIISVNQSSFVEPNRATGFEVAPVKE